MDIDHVFVVFCARPGGVFTPVAREQIPDWLRDQDVIDRMLTGEVAMQPDDPQRRIYKIIEVDRPRPVGQREVCYQINRGGKSAGGIVLDS